MNTRFQSNCLILTDFVAFYLSFALGFGALALWAGFGSERDFLTWFATTGLSHLLTFSIFVVFAVGRFVSLGTYQKRMLYWDELPAVFETTFIFAVLHGVTVFIFRSPLSRTLWLASWFFAPWLVLFFRSLTKKTLRRFGYWEIRIICIGQDLLSEQFLRLARTEPLLGFRIEAILPWPEQQSFLTIGEYMKQRVRQAKPDLVLVATQNPQALKLFQSLSSDFPNVHLVPPLQGMPLLGLQPQLFFSHEIFLLSPKASWVQKSEGRFKRLFDIGASIVLFVLLSPVFLALSLAMVISEPGAPIFFQQKRHGFRGALFKCYKFRSMVPDAEKRLHDLLATDPEARREWAEKTKISNDPRVTGLGDFLRKTSLDELPQLWNVLKGDMSLVGPRPISPYENEKYGKEFETYQKFRPGMTGLWQVSGRSDTSFDYRIFLDTWYIRNWSPWYDLAILFKPSA